MRNKDQILLENLYTLILESQTRSSESEIKFYLDEVFGSSADELEFFKSTTEYNNPKFDKVIFGFSYKGTMYVKVFSGAGEDASKSDSGSLSVSVFIKTNKKSNYDKKETNAFYNRETQKVNYDPIIKNGKDLLLYVKSILDEDDRDKEYKYTPAPNKPDIKNKPQPVLA
jgi:hypothetical protein